MGFELNIPQASGIPDGSLISIRLGNVRRQAFFGANYAKKPLKFPEISKNEPMKVDVFYPIAKARWSLDASGQSFSFPFNVRVAFFAKDGEMAASFKKLGGGEAGNMSDMSMDVKIVQCVACAREEKRNSYKAAVDYQQYLQKHMLVEALQDLLQTLMKDRPSDPYARMIESLQSKKPQPVEVPLGPTISREKTTEEWVEEKRKLIQDKMLQKSTSGQLTRIFSTSLTSPTHGELTGNLASTLEQQYEEHNQVSSPVPGEIKKGDSSMGIELSIQQASGIPDGSLISIRLGNVRRQALFGSKYAKKPFNFPEITCKSEPMKVDVFYPIAQARFSLAAGGEPLNVPLFSIEGYRKITKLGGDEAGSSPHMSIDLETIRGIACASEDKRIREKDEWIEETPEVDRSKSGARRHLAALDSQQYLQKHLLLETFQALLQILIKDRPSDPFAYMIQQVMSQHQQPVEVRESPRTPRESPRQSSSEPASMDEKRKLLQNALVEKCVSGDLPHILSMCIGEQTGEDDVGRAEFQNKTESPTHKSLLAQKMREKTRDGSFKGIVENVAGREFSEIASESSTYSPGARKIITGMKTDPELNGKSCSIINQGWLVEVDPAGSGQDLGSGRTAFCTKENLMDPHLLDT